ncbi:MAG: sensor histidine kinase [Thermodesulfobacteriota bacterium]
MKIRDKLIFIAVLPLLLALGGAGVQFYNARLIGEYTEKARVADALYKQMASQTLLTTEYHMFYEKRARTQWQELHASLGRELDEVSVLFNSPAEVRILTAAKRSHETLGFLFEQYGPHQPHENNQTWRKYAERITNRILQEQELIIPELEELHTINHLASLALSARQSKLFTLFFIGFALTIPASAVLIYRSFSRPLQAVQKAIQEFATGNQGYRINSTARDEIGEVARAFDRMADQRTRALQARREAEQLLVHQSRLAAMGEMIGAIAHQWRQPLNTVNAIIQDIKDAHSFNELNQEYLERSVQDAMRQIHFMSRTIDDFRDFFRPDKELKPFDIKLAAGEVLIMLSSQLAANQITYRIVCHQHQRFFENFTTQVVRCGEMEILGYENEMKQVFLNLINNARDAIVARREEGNLAEEEVGVISLEFEREGNWVVARITDNGGGIPEDILGRVFDPYFTTKEQGKGTGIGLYMSKMIVEKNMNGKLSAKNVANGAEFRIEVEVHGQQA